MIIVADSKNAMSFIFSPFEKNTVSKRRRTLDLVQPHSAGAKTAHSPEAYHQVFEEPLRAREHVRDLTPETGLYALGLFRCDAFRFEAQKLRLIQAFTYPHDRESKLLLARRLRTRDFAALPAAERFAFRVAFRVSGYFHVLSALRDAFRGPRFEGEHPERYPSFVEDESGEIRSRDPSEPADSRPTTR
jgi:hypothetical protein